MRHSLIAALVATLAFAGVGRAQVGDADSIEIVEVPVDTIGAPAPEAPPPAPPHDRIMAVVGAHILLESEWREQTEVLAGQLGVDPRSGEMRDLSLQSFQQMLRDLVILAAAEQDTAVQVDTERVTEEADEEIARIRSRFPNETEFQRQLSQSQWGNLAAYRADIMERKRRELLGQAYLDLHQDEIQPRPVSDEELRTYWDENSASFGRSPTTVRFEEIPVLVEPSEDVRAAAREEAEEVLNELRTGATDFAAAALQHSDDPGSSDKGGDTGWFGRGRMVEPFEAAAFESQPGEIVGPVETQFGYHILQVTDKRGDEVRARHVLIAFEATDADRVAARTRAESLVADIRAGADVDSLQAIAMPDDSISAGVIELGASQVPPVYAQALQGMAPGEATVIETPTGFSVLVSRGTGGGEEVEFEQIAPRLRAQLSQQRAEEAFVERLEDRIYVDVRVPPERALQGA